MPDDFTRQRGKTWPRKGFNSTMDKQAVKVVKGDETVGHLPGKFSRIVWYFLACKSNANDNRRISWFVLAIYRQYIRETSCGLANVKTINQRDIGTIFMISRRDIVLARLRYNDISQSNTINRHNISLQRSSL